MAGMDDMMDWMIDEACHSNPLVDAADAYYAALGLMDRITVMKMNQATYVRLNDAFRAEYPTHGNVASYNDAKVIIDSDLPDNVYKFD